MVNYVEFKKHKEINGNRWISLFAFLLCILAFVILIIQQFQSNTTGVIIALSIFGLCFVGEWLYKKNQ